MGKAVTWEREQGEKRKDGAVAARYSRYESIRSPYLQRAREAAQLTIPTLVPPIGHSNGGYKFPTPYQALGARGVNNLASKLLLALLPPNASFFRLSIDDFELVKLTKQRGMRAKVEEAFGQIERSVILQIETSAARVKVFEALKLLIVSGNVLLFVMPDSTIRVFPLSRYVVKRDPVGNVLEIITKEDLSPLAIPPEVRMACGVDADEDNPDNHIPLFTYVYREEDGNRFSIYQELNGKVVPGSEGFYPIDETPWIPLRFAAVENEDYGRGYVEEYIGDLKSLEGLSKAMLEAAAAASKVLYLLKPNATTNKKKLVEAPNGAVIEGNLDDIGILQLDKYGDFRVAFEQSQELTKRLSFAFMLNTSVQRNGERVTAEEIRYMAGELEDALGGVYSILSQEFQLPLVRVLMKQMSSKGKLPQLPKDLVKPMVTTGLEALGRGHDLNKLTQFIQQLAPLGPEVIAQYMNVGDYISRVGTSLGIDTEGLVKSEDQIAQERQQAALMQMAQQVGPEVAKQAMSQQSQ